MEVQVAVAKVAKWASRESGDTLEMIERPGGGVSLVLVDGQQSGKGAKAISNLVARKAVSLLAEGVRDGATARAAHDYLYAHHHGKVQATLNIVSLDLTSQTLVLSRNNPNPIYIAKPTGLVALDSESKPVGLYRHTKPIIHEIPLEPETAVVVYTDGLPSAGIRKSNPLDVRAAIEQLHTEGMGAAQTWADQLLAQALVRDDSRPVDDVSILVVVVLPRQTTDEARRLLMRMPLA